MHINAVVPHRLVFEDFRLTPSKLLVNRIMLVCNDELLVVYFQIEPLIISMPRRNFHWKDLTIENIALHDLTADCK